MAVVLGLDLLHAVPLWQVLLALGLAVLLAWRWQQRANAFSLENKVVVLTGAASGLGRCLALRIARLTRSVTLVLLDVDDRGLQRVREEILAARAEESKQESIEVLLYVCDVSNESDVERCFKAILKQCAPRPIGVLVNNAGIVSGRPLAELTSQQIRRTIEVNVLGHFWTVQQALPSMLLAPDAMIVTLSSVMGMLASAGLTDYCASKAAVASFHESLRLELRRQRCRSIRMLLVCPSAVDTGMFDGILQGTSLQARLAQFVCPFLRPADVAARIHRAMLADAQELFGCYSGWRALVIPWLPAVTRALSVPLHDLAMAIGGGVHGMDTFVGRGGKEKETEQRESRHRPMPSIHS